MRYAARRTDRHTLNVVEMTKLRDRRTQRTQTHATRRLRVSERSRPYGPKSTTSMCWRLVVQLAVRRVVQQIHNRSKQVEFGSIRSSVSRALERQTQGHAADARTHGHDTRSTRSLNTVDHARHAHSTRTHAFVHARTRTYVT